METQTDYDMVDLAEFESTEILLQNPDSLVFTYKDFPPLSSVSELQCGELQNPLLHCLYCPLSHHCYGHVSGDKKGWKLDATLTVTMPIPY